MCCAGCQAVAQAIVANGLDDYYRHRDALPESPREALPRARDLALYDHPDVQKNFVRPRSEHEREAALILEGITCAACVWLNEQHDAPARCHAVDINYATRRARVRWDERRRSALRHPRRHCRHRLPRLPLRRRRSEEIGPAERRSALWRLFVAGFGMMQVMMYAVPVYLADEGHERRHRAADALGQPDADLPVCCIPPRPSSQRAWRDLRLRRVGMDVPVALGVGAAFAASLWATLIGRGEVYFDSVTMFVFFLLGGRYLEMLARQKAARGVERWPRPAGLCERLRRRYPVPEGERVPVSNCARATRCGSSRARPCLPTAVVLEGESEATKSLLTGESRPVPKRRRAAALIGGSRQYPQPAGDRAVEQVARRRGWPPSCA
jgi:Cu2+-exporting ATPase